MTLHEDEVPAGPATVRALLAAQCPQWADLPLAAAGAGTDNTMYRLGTDLLVRLPRTAGTARSLRTEQEWLPRLAPLLPHRIPAPVHLGTPAAGYPLPWSVHCWLDGAEVGPDSVTDWAALGTDLATFVRDLHATDLMGATRAGDLSWYRGGDLRSCDDWITGCLRDCRAVVGADLDLDTLTRYWRAGLAQPEPAGPYGWLHGDLKPTNLLARNGKLYAVIDFGCLSVGLPDAEHAPVWDLPAAARHAYRDALDVPDPTWIRARAWAVAVAASGIAYYRGTFPAFVAECRARLGRILADPF